MGGLLAKSKRRERAPRLRCGKCSSLFQSRLLGPNEKAICEGCASAQEFYVFPAFARKPAPCGVTDVVPGEGDEHCYYLEDRKAVATCGDCGRPVSAFMKVAIGSEVSCLTCLETKREDKDDPRVETRRIACDNRALMIAALPVVTVIAFPVSLLTAPLALFFVLRDRSAGTLSILSKSHWKFGLATALAVLQIGFWSWTIYSAWDSMPKDLNASGAEYQGDDLSSDDSFDFEFDVKEPLP